ncbi:MAG: hypothetical protein NT085_01615 [candidate division SR1 bacterium]|nr:hypothetical protein [candidate division SR1 bacterium]
MKKKLFLSIALVAIATMFMSCGRYNLKESLQKNDISSDTIHWKTVIADSTAKNIIHYCIIMGEKNSPSVSQVLIHNQFGILDIPDTLLKNVPMYYECFYLGEPMIFQCEEHRTVGATLWKAPQTTFTLKAMDPIHFDQVTLQRTVRDARLFWQITIAVLFVVCFLIALLNILDYDDDNLFIIIICCIVALAMFILSWCYLAYFVSILFSLCIFLSIVIPIISAIRSYLHEKHTNKHMNHVSKDETHIEEISEEKK